MARPWHTPRLPWQVHVHRSGAAHILRPRPELQSGCRFERFWTWPFALLAPLTKYLRLVRSTKNSLSTISLTWLNKWHASRGDVGTYRVRTLFAGAHSAQGALKLDAVIAIAHWRGERRRDRAEPADARTWR